MTIELNKKELEALKALVKTELKETKDLINTANGSDKQELSDYYNILYMTQQQLSKAQ